VVIDEEVCLSITTHHQHPMTKIVVQLPRPLPASNDCLPHAAMNLGASRGVGLKPTEGGMVSRLVIEPQLGAWVFYRLDANGGFVGDSWHETKEDAIYQAKREFNLTIDSI
jgi:hypothetical protein